MLLDKLGYSFNAEKYGIDPKNLEGKELEDQVQVVLDKMNEYIADKTAEKEQYNEQKVEALQKAAEYKKKSSKAKGQADRCRTQLITLRKDFNEKIDLINYKKNK